MKHSLLMRFQLHTRVPEHQQPRDQLPLLTGPALLVLPKPLGGIVAESIEVH